MKLTFIFHDEAGDRIVLKPVIIPRHEASITPESITGAIKETTFENPVFGQYKYLGALKGHVERFAPATPFTLGNKPAIEAGEP